MLEAYSHVTYITALEEVKSYHIRHANIAKTRETFGAQLSRGLCHSQTNIYISGLYIGVCDY